MEFYTVMQSKEDINTVTIICTTAADLSHLLNKLHLHHKHTTPFKAYLYKHFNVTHASTLECEVTHEAKTRSAIVTVFCNVPHCKNVISNWINS